MFSSTSIIGIRILLKFVSWGKPFIGISYITFTDFFLILFLPVIYLKSTSGKVSLL